MDFPKFGQTWSIHHNVVNPNTIDLLWMEEILHQLIYRVSTILLVAQDFATIRSSLTGGMVFLVGFTTL